ncbi:MAG: DUF262 domain-containing protein [Planctomycetes bacterium]|nr:DUF262 domain-containing protein [Planctomycetota bacterium]
MDKLLAEARRAAFSIPRFQRDFVWNRAQVSLLIDSIARNYPIGSLLLLAENDPKNPFLASRPVQAVLKEADGEPDETSDDAPNRFYVLDGQQRLTSIVRVFLQAARGGLYYFDLKKLRHFDDNPNDTDWIVWKPEGRAISTRFIRSDAVIDRQRCQVLVEEFFETADEELTGDRPKQRLASAKVNGIFETIRNYQVPLVIIDRNESLEAICRIFETINSTGTRLTTFDLAVARFFPDPDLHAFWEKGKSEFPILERYKVDGERALQVIALLESVAQKTYASATRGTILRLAKDVVRERWSESVRWLAAAYEWAEQHGIAPGMFPNEALMVPLAVFFSYADDSWRRKQPSYLNVLEKWYFASILQQGARQASNYRIAEATNELLLWRNDGVVPSAPRVILTPELVSKIRPTDNRYRAILAFLRWQAGVDLWTGEPLAPGSVEDHHIFPAALAKRNGIDRVLLDSVGNRLLVSTDTNRDLGDRLPQDYLLRVLDDTRKANLLNRRLDLLRSACIVLPDTREEMLASLDVSAAVSFITNRAARICDSLERVLGDSLQRAATEEDE